MGLLVVVLALLVDCTVMSKSERQKGFKAELGQLLEALVDTRGASDLLLGTRINHPEKDVGSAVGELILEAMTEEGKNGAKILYGGTGDEVPVSPENIWRSVRTSTVWSPQKVKRHMCGKLRRGTMVAREGDWKEKVATFYCSVRPQLEWPVRDGLTLFGVTKEKAEAIRAYLEWNTIGEAADHKRRRVTYGSQGKGLSPGCEGGRNEHGMDDNMGAGDAMPGTGEESGGPVWLESLIAPVVGPAPSGEGGGKETEMEADWCGVPDGSGRKTFEGKGYATLQGTQHGCVGIFTERLQGVPVLTEALVSIVLDPNGLKENLSACGLGTLFQAAQVNDSGQKKQCVPYGSNSDSGRYTLKYGEETTDTAICRPLGCRNQGEADKMYSEMGETVGRFVHKVVGGELYHCEHRVQQIQAVVTVPMVKGLGGTAQQMLHRDADVSEGHAGDRSDRVARSNHGEAGRAASGQVFVTGWVERRIRVFPGSHLEEFHGNGSVEDFEKIYLDVVGDAIVLENGNGQKIFAVEIVLPPWSVTIMHPKLVHGGMDGGAEWTEEKFNKVKAAVVTDPQEIHKHISVGVFGYWGTQAMSSVVGDQSFQYGRGVPGILYPD